MCQGCQQTRTPPLQVGQLTLDQLQARAMLRAHLRAFHQAHAIGETATVVQTEAGGDQPLK
ncbi:hypothetical protein ADT26_12405 [Xanthomonas oryzae]|nr:hypothetical protein AXO1947_19160 [Xanthomonas oryzae pv. oryzae]KOR43011.1 hypothetical protein ADT26_12405 [Xanthomonas oryzae]